MDNLDWYNLQLWNSYFSSLLYKTAIHPVIFINDQIIQLIRLSFIIIVQLINFDNFSLPCHFVIWLRVFLFFWLIWWNVYKLRHIDWSYRLIWQEISIDQNRSFSSPPIYRKSVQWFLPLRRYLFAKQLNLHLESHRKIAFSQNRIISY